MLLQFFGLIYPALQKLTNEFIMLGLFKIQAAYFKYLNKALEEIEVQSYKDLRNAQEQLKIWLKLHQAVIRFVNL